MHEVLRELSMPVQVNAQQLREPEGSRVMGSGTTPMLEGAAAARDNARARDEWHPPTGSGFRETCIAFLWACLIIVPILGIGGRLIYSDWREREDARLAAIWATQAYERLIAAPAEGIVSVSDAVHGRDLFTSVCIACHGLMGTGVEGLGKNLVRSDFVAGSTDEALCEFLAAGRPNARPVAMPPKGGRDDLTDDDLAHIVAYVRGLQDPRRMPELPAMVATPPSEEQKVAALEAAGGDTELAGYIASGDKLFHSTCIACHGKAGTGIQGNGKALAMNSFIQSLDDDGLLAFVKQGRLPTDPKNTSGIQMPPKGGNPALSDDDILDIISYLRTLQAEKLMSSSAGQ